MEMEELFERVSTLESQVLMLREMQIRQSGELLGATAGIRVLLMAHPDLNAAREELLHQLELLQSVGLGESIADAVLDGVERARRQMLPTAHDVQRGAAP